jgi:hypothetical protein
LTLPFAAISDPFHEEKPVALFSLLCFPKVGTNVLSTAQTLQIGAEGSAPMAFHHSPSVSIHELGRR